MESARYQQLLDRIVAEGDTLDTHYRENPEQAHNFRLADALATLTTFRFCGGAREHFDCLFSTSSIAWYLYALTIIKPSVLEEIYTEFKDEFQAMIPEGIMFYRAIECREYPVPPELTKQENPA